jgi:hypothetical protein
MVIDLKLLKGKKVGVIKNLAKNFNMQVSMSIKISLKPCTKNIKAKKFNFIIFHFQFISI